MALTLGLGSNIGGPVTVTARLPGVIDLFGTGTDNKIYEATQRNGAWYNQGSILSNAFFSDLSSATWDGSRIDLFGRGTEDGCWQTSYSTATGWSQRLLGNQGAQGPRKFQGGFDVVTRAPGSLDIFGRGTDNLFWWLPYDSNTTPDTIWKSLGGTWTTDPAVVSWGGNRLDVFGGQVLNDIWHVWSDGGAWTADYLGGFSHEQPTAVTVGSGSLAVFSRDQQNYVSAKFFANGSWSDWSRVTSRPSVVRPTAVAWGGNSITLAYVGSDGNVYLRKLVGTDASKWDDAKSMGLGVTATDSPTLHPKGGANSTVFVRVAGGTILAKDFQL